MHREDVIAAIKKQFGTLTAFERAHALPRKSVNDVLRGRKSARVQRAIDTVVLGETRNARENVDNYSTKSRHGKAA